MTLRALSLTFAVLLLGGCATPPASVTRTGELPNAGSYAFVEAEAISDDMKTAIATGLGQRSLAPAEQPQYLVQTSLSHPLAKTGTLVPNPTSPQWQRPPARGGKPLARVTLSITTAATGAEVYHAAAWQPSNGKPDEAAALTALALAPPAPPAQ